jgi:hypothetical protein
MNIHKSDLNSGKESMKKLKALVKKMKLNVFYGSADKGENLFSFCIYIYIYRYRY